MRSQLDSRKSEESPNNLRPRVSWKRRNSQGKRKIKDPLVLAIGHFALHLHTKFSLTKCEISLSEPGSQDGMECYPSV